MHGEHDVLMIQLHFPFLSLFLNNYNGNYFILFITGFHIQRNELLLLCIRPHSALERVQDTGKYIYLYFISSDRYHILDF